MGGIKKIRGGMDVILETCLVVLFWVMVIVGTYQILVRYLFNRPSTMSEEFLTYAFAWLSLLAAAYMFGKKGHMRMGFLADRMKEENKLRLDLISECLVFLFAAIVMVYGGVQITSLTMAQKTASLGIPMGYVYSIVPAGGVLILVYSILNIAELMSGHGRDAEPEPDRRGREIGEDLAEEAGSCPEQKAISGFDKEKVISSQDMNLTADRNTQQKEGRKKEEET